MSRSLRRLITVAVVAAAAMIASGSLSAYWLKSWTAALVYAVAALGVGILYGRVGLVSLSNVALLGVGAWITMRLATSPLRWHPSVAALVAAVVTSAIGTIVGLPALRVRGLTLALLTLLMAGAFSVVITATGFPEGGTGFTGRGGTARLVNMPRPSFATSDLAYLRYVVVIVAGAFVVAGRIVHGRAGRAWALMAEGDEVARAAGVRVVAMQAGAYALAGFLSGLAGGLYAGHVGRPSPQEFGPVSSMLLFGLAVSAGVHHLGGAVIAGVLGRIVPALFNDWGVPADVATMVFGFLLLVSLAGTTGAAGQLGAVATRVTATLRSPRSTGVPAP